MAVIMVIGNQPRLPHSLFDPGATMSSVIAQEFGDPSGPLHAASLVELGLLLLVFSLVVNLVARFIVTRLGKRLGVDRL
jgi:phosphate transport system permease protein